MPLNKQEENTMKRETSRSIKQEPPMKHEALPTTTTTTKPLKTEQLRSIPMSDAPPLVHAPHCNLCKSPFAIRPPRGPTKHNPSPPLVPSAMRRLRCWCCQRTLLEDQFSLNQLASDRARGERRCWTCAPKGNNGVALITQRDGPIKQATLARALAKRKATIALKKQREDERKRLGVDVEEEKIQAAAAREQDERREMEKTIRGILRDHRSIQRRLKAASAMDNTENPETTQLLDEEATLLGKVVALRRTNEHIYDLVSGELATPDPNEPVAGDPSKGFASSHALLEAAKTTARTSKRSRTTNVSKQAVPPAKKAKYAVRSRHQKKY